MTLSFLPKMKINVDFTGIYVLLMLNHSIDECGIFLHSFKSYIL